MKAIKNNPVKQTLLLVSFFIIASCCNKILFAQAGAAKIDTIKTYSPVADSLEYINEIVANKQKYVNKPLSVLLNDLKISIQSFSIDHDRLRSLGILIYFDNSYNVKEEKWNMLDRAPVNILIEWEKSILRSDIEASLHRGAGEWTTAAQQYFSNEIISDIVVPYREGK